MSTGRIQFQNKHTNTTITAGQVITCDEEGHTTVTSMTPQHNLSWTEGIISFDDQSLENIMNHIERMYDVTVHYSDDNIKQLRFTGECSRFQSVEDFLTVLSTTEDFHFHMEERDIYIYPATQGNEIQE